MKVLVCLIAFLASAYAGLVAYPYVPIVRAPVVHGGFPLTAIGGHALTEYKPIYTGFYDYRLGLSPAVYPLGVFPGGGVYAAAPTILHLVPASAPNGKDKPKKSDKPGDEKDVETTTKPSKDNAEDVEKAEAKDEEGSSKDDSAEVESV